MEISISTSMTRLVNISMYESHFSPQYDMIEERIKGVSEEFSDDAIEQFDLEIPSFPTENYKRGF